MEGGIRIFLLRAASLVLCMAVISGCAGNRVADSGVDESEAVIQPEVERREIKPAKIDTEDFEIGADIVLKATKVDGVFSADPNIVEDAELFEFLSYDQVIEGKLGVMDANAIVLCRDQSMPIRVFNVFGTGNLMNIVLGEPVGTLIR